MTTSDRINLLTPEQEALIPEYQEKWQKIAFSTEPIDKEKAEAAVKNAYAVMKKKAPKIIFIRSPKEALALKADKVKSAESPNLPPVTPQIFMFVLRILQEISSLWASWINWLLSILPRQIRMIFSFLLWIPAILWLILLLPITTIINLFAASKIKTNYAIARLQQQLAKSANDSITKQIKSQLPKKMTPQDTVQQGMQNMADIHPQIRERMSIPNFQNSNSQVNNSNYQVDIEEEFPSFPLQNQFLHAALKNSYLASLQAKIMGINHIQLDIIIRNSLLRETGGINLFQKFPPVFTSQSCAIYFTWLDFAKSVLNLPLDNEQFQAYRDIVRECGWIFAWDNTCVICNRPRKISLDNENRFHAEGEAAIKFEDGFKIYALHGVILPEKYGTIKPESWSSQWLLSEENAELRRILIQEIGYEKICEELEAIKIDSWREYELLKFEIYDDWTNVNNNVFTRNSADLNDPEPIFLIKMTCPSTGKIHALRVPPHIQSAREAIKWANWDIDPEDFTTET